MPRWRWMLGATTETENAVPGPALGFDRKSVAGAIDPMRHEVRCFVVTSLGISGFVPGREERGRELGASALKTERVAEAGPAPWARIRPCRGSRRGHASSGADHGHCRCACLRANSSIRSWTYGKKGFDDMRPSESMLTTSSPRSPRAVNAPRWTP